MRLKQWLTWLPVFLVRQTERTIAASFASIRHTCFLLLLSISLSGCIDYDVAIQYHSPNQGEFVQHIQLSERLKTLNREAQQQWIKAIQKTTQTLGGKFQPSPDSGLTVTIPFSSSAELEKKFNQFYSVLGKSPLLGETKSSIPAVTGHLTIQRSNFILLERNRLRYEVDLRSLGVRSTDGDVLVSPTSLIAIEFKLNTPWGSRSSANSETLRPRSLSNGKKLIWTLIPGAENLIDTTFWMPNPLGFGTLAILLFVLLGKFLKYPQPSEILHPPTQQSSL
jgi:hypothetical protein